MFVKSPIVSISNGLHKLVLLLCGATLCYGAPPTYDCHIITNTSLWRPVTATVGLFDGESYTMNFSQEILQHLSLGGTEYDYGVHIDFEGCNITVECEGVELRSEDLVLIWACDMLLPPLVLTLNSISNWSCGGSENSTNSSSYIALSAQLPGNFVQPFLFQLSWFLFFKGGGGS